MEYIRQLRTRDLVSSSKLYDICELSSSIVLTLSQLHNAGCFWDALTIHLHIFSKGTIIKTGPKNEDLEKR